MESRLKQIRRELGLTQGEMAEKMGCSKANISMIETGKSILTEKNKLWLVKLFNINPEFIETGKGPIMPAGPDRCADSREADRIPLFDLKGISKLEQLFHPAGGIVPEGYISIPNMPRCDGAVYYVGDMMYPILRSGDMVLYSRLADTSEIFWGDMYLLAVETSGGEYISVCRLDKSENHGKAIMHGADPGRSSTEIDIARIKAIAFVKATIRMNSAK